MTTSAVETLIASREGYEGTPLAEWSRQKPSAFLEKLAELRAAFPFNLAIATDYLFAESSYAYEEILEKINLADVKSPTFDRMASMQGGFPWTDSTWPWPRLNDGTMARPCLQINLARIADATGLSLPNIIFQYWGAEIGALAIPLDDLEKSIPDPAYPEFNISTDTLVWPDDTGWAVDVAAAPAEAGWVGNKISVGSRVFKIADISAFLEDEDPDMPTQWDDVVQWLHSNGLTYPLAVSISDRLAPIDPDYFEMRDACRKAFQSDIHHSRLSSSGSFCWMPSSLPGFTKYPDLVMRGMTSLYDPGQLPGTGGLRFDGGEGAVVVLLKPTRTPVPVEFLPDEPEVGVHHSIYGQDGRETFL